jgi:transmembrane sensor
LVQWRPEHSDEPNPDLLANFWFQKSWFMKLSSFAAAAVLLLGFSIWQPWQPTEHFNGYLPEEGVMAHVYQIHRLQDGSIVELNTGAQIAIRYSGTERRVDLLSGEVYFEVAKNPSRPFIVSARGIEVKAVGTAFNVKLGDDSLEVVVTHGKVLMDSSALVATSDLKDAVEPTIAKPELGAGQRSIISFISEAMLPFVEAISEDEIDEKLTWKHQVLEFVNRPLSEIVEEFNRYNTRQIIIRDKELLSTQITATFRSYNVEGFVRLLELTSPVHVSSENDESITLIKKSGLY